MKNENPLTIETYECDCCGMVEPDLFYAWAQRGGNVTFAGVLCDKCYERFMNYDEWFELIVMARRAEREG